VASKRHRPATLVGDLSMRIELNCADCGDNRFTIIHGMDDSAEVLCSECGKPLGTMAELKERVAQEVMRRSMWQPPKPD